jgi:hypothetical protein
LFVPFLRSLTSCTAGYGRNRKRSGVGADIPDLEAFEQMWAESEQQQQQQQEKKAEGEGAGAAGGQQGEGGEGGASGAPAPGSPDMDALLESHDEQEATSTSA